MKNQEPNDTACRRCGTCCRKGGPALHTQDLPLFEGPNALPLSLLVTLRAGEQALDQVRGRVFALGAEVLKLRGRTKNGQAGQACALLNQADNSCSLYARRPAECRALSCRDTAPLAAMYDKDRLTRADLLPPGHGLLAVMAEHEELVPVQRIAPLAAAFRAGGQDGLDAQEELARMAVADRAFRAGLSRRAGIGPEYHECFLGRDASALFAAAGLCLRADAKCGLRVQTDPLAHVAHPV